MRRILRDMAESVPPVRVGCGSQPHQGPAESRPLHGGAAISGVNTWVVVGSQAILGALSNAPAELLPRMRRVPGSRIWEPATGNRELCCSPPRMDTKSVLNPGGDYAWESRGGSRSGCLLV